jgi:HK97 family phage portal protein
VGIFDWLGPTSLTKRGWDALPALPEPLALKAQAPGMIEGFNAALTIRTLVHGPGASDLSYGSGGTNSAVFACLQAIATAVAEPELAVYRVAPGERVELDDTDLGNLLARPNPHFSLDTLLSYLSVCLHVDGNAYWRKLRAGDPLTGEVVQLWPIAPSRMTVRTDSGTGDFITAYRYYYSLSEYIDLPPSDVVHFRYGLDDRDHRLGLAPLKQLAREVSSDNQATRYADRLLANLAVNGLTLTFDKEAPAINQQTADELKARVQAAYGGDNVGGTAVLSPGAQLHALGFSPEQMDMKTLHRVPEERISAVLGVPAIVAGLGAGLDRSTFSNVREAREMFTEAKLIPLWRSIASEITLQLVPDFTNDTSTLVDFDTSEVRAFADDENAEAIRLKTLVEAGIISVDEARAEIGYEPAAAPIQPPQLAAAAARRSTATRSVRILPGRKAAEDLPGRYESMRSAELPDWELELITFLAQQERRVLRRLRAGADHADELVTEGEAILLGETLTPLQLRVLGEVSRLVVGELGIAFQLDDAVTRQYLVDAGVNIRGITETTRADVADALTEGQMAGEGIEQLARRLRDLPAFDQARGRIVARTELGTSQNLAALSSYRASGVVIGVRVLDGDYDAACSAMDGRTFALDQAPPALQHPNCVRSFSPLTDPADLVSDAGRSQSSA